MLDLPQSHPSLSSQVLQALVFYLSIVSCGEIEHARHFRSTLITRLETGILKLMTASPNTLSAIQTMEILAMFAPFGLLPGRPTSIASLTIARGYVTTCLSMAARCNLKASATHNFVQERRLAWASSDVWAWLTLVTVDAMMRFEDQRPLAPAALDEAAMMAEALAQHASADTTLEMEVSDPCFLAKVASCERLQRLQVTFKALRGTKRSSVAVPTFLVMDSRRSQAYLEARYLP